MSKFLEIGPGRGDFLFHLAEENPLATIVGVEVKPKRFDKLSARVAKKELTNVQLYQGDARIVLPQEFEDNTFEAIYILFSDPWPKRRHAKHRLFQADFIRELLRVLKPDGTLYIAHDDPRYLQQIEEVFREFAADFVQSDEGIDFKTFYADKWLKEGRTLRSFSYRKINHSDDRNILGGPCAIPAYEDTGDVS